MSSREEHQKCVVRADHTNADGKRRHTWCGREPEVFEWTFTDAEHAALTGAHGDRLLACPACAKAITAGLLGEVTG